ncbi:MAG: hypothetical protein M3417_04770, partial [Actinomycetota bacterium]|nr:hypothetical protein [Actinomycetota bacterium]
FVMLFEPGTRTHASTGVDGGCNFKALGMRPSLPLRAAGPRNRAIQANPDKDCVRLRSTLVLEALNVRDR